MRSRRGFDLAGLCTEESESDPVGFATIKTQGGKVVFEPERLRAVAHTGSGVHASTLTGAVGEGAREHLAQTRCSLINIAKHLNNTVCAARLKKPQYFNDMKSWYKLRENNGDREGRGKTGERKQKRD